MRLETWFAFILDPSAISRWRRFLVNRKFGVSMSIEAEYLPGDRMQLTGKRMFGMFGRERRRHEPRGGDICRLFERIATMNDLAIGGSVSRCKIERVVSRLFLAMSVMLTTAGVARADKYTDIEHFAQSICGDIPEATLTRTSIQGKVKANAGTLARLLISGDANASVESSEEILKGIPLEKLPANIPTVSMCKLELVKTIVYNSPFFEGKPNGGYSTQAKRRDLVAVDDFINRARMIIDEQSDCRRFNYTQTAYIGGATMRALNELNQTNCETPSINEEECSASVDDLREMIEISDCGEYLGDYSSKPRICPGKFIVLRCLIGNCVSCKKTEGKLRKDYTIDWHHRVYNTSALTIFVGDRSRYDQNDMAMYKKFLRSLSRIISGGTDEAFCRKNASVCN